MSDEKIKVGSKIIRNGWIDYQESPEWKKPYLHISSGQNTTFKTSDLKEKLKQFIDAQTPYYFQGIKINPDVDEVLEKFKLHKGRIKPINKFDNSDYRLGAYFISEAYFTAFDKLLFKEQIPHIKYDLATRDSNSYVAGILSWPTIFITSSKSHTSLIEKVEEINNSENCFNTYINNELHKIIRKANMKPLQLDEDTSLEVKGDLIQKMSNILFTYRGKHTLPNHSCEDW